jgi:hypothetical protein
MEKSFHPDDLGTRGPFLRFARQTLDHSDDLALTQHELATVARRPRRRDESALRSTYAALGETKDVLAQTALSIQRTVGALGWGENARSLQAVAQNFA